MAGSGGPPGLERAKGERGAGEDDRGPEVNGVRGRRARLFLAAVTLALAVSGSAAAVSRAHPAPPGQPTPVVTAPVSAPKLDPTTCTTVRVSPPTAPPHDADLCTPATPRHHIGIVVIHGGGGYAGDRRSSIAWVHRLNAAGYLTLAVEYTLFDPAVDHGPVFPNQEREVKAAVQWLRSHGTALGIDDNRVIAFGNSHGAAIGGVLLVTPDDAFYDGPAKWPAVSDRIDGFIGVYGYYDGFNLHPDIYFGGSADLRRQADVRAVAARASGPTLLFHGDADSYVPTAESVDFAAALRDAGKDVQLQLVPGAGHSYDRPEDQILTSQGEVTAEQALAWLDRHFPGR